LSLGRKQRILTLALEQVRMTQRLTLIVDGKAQAVEVEDPDMPLLYALRDDLGPNNPRFGSMSSWATRHAL
jgi:hypothetical protein